MREKLDKNKKIILTIIAVLILCVGSTLAYIIAQLQDEARGNASVTSDAVDILKFEIDKDINLIPTQFNVVEGGDNLSDTAVGSAILRANSTNDSATYNYYVYFQINSNNYIYTTEEQIPEIVLTIIDPEGSPVTSISGLDYVTSGGVSGFDITTKSGLYKVAELYEIVSTSSSEDTIQEWEFTVSFINLDTNQAENGGKTLEAEVILSREPADYHKVCNSSTLACTVAQLYNEENPESTGLYYHNGSIKKIGNSCTYNDTPVISYDTMNYEDVTEESCQNVYQIVYYGDDDVEITELMDSTINNYYNSEGVLVEWNSETNTCITTNDGSRVYDWYGNRAAESQCVGLAYYNNEWGEYHIGITELGSGTFSANLVEIILDAEDKSYRYSGEDPNNYVCFGTDETSETSCPSDNLYRIIGVFNGQVKLIKADYATVDELGTNGDYGDDRSASRYDTYKGQLTTINGYYWNNINSDLANQETGYENIWSYSQLNTINLNTNFLNSFDSTWQNMVATTEWQVGGMSEDFSATAKNYYDIEIGNSSSSTTYSAKIGLMYLSDYGYAASPEAWRLSVDDYDCLDIRNNNWMYMGVWEWTITRGLASLTQSNCAWLVDSYGSPGNYYYNQYSDFGIRPSFYISSSALYSSGDGSIDNPYRIEI